MAGRLLLAFSFVTLVLPCPALGQRAENPERAAVLSLITSFGEHLQARDLSAIESLFRAGGMFKDIE